MKIQRQPLGFWCRHCNAVRHADEYEYRETEDHYEYRCICPVCRAPFVSRQESILAYLKRISRKK